jgi:hypothetical protein
LTPGHDYRQCVAVPPDAFPLLFLLSQRRCADVRCHGGDRRFSLIDIDVLDERPALLGLKESWNNKPRLMVCYSVSKSINKTL